MTDDMDTGEQGGGFARDLGYLDLFFDKLEQHARGAGAGTSGEQLLRFVAEERTRWAEARAWVGGASAPEPKAATAIIADDMRAFTVGSLTGRQG